MAVKNFYVLAFPERVSLPYNPDTIQPHFLGKTTDLSFKTEPDKSVDLDDGTTEVGSEKLSLTLSILGAIDNPWPISEIWLVPMIGSKAYPEHGYIRSNTMDRVLRIFLTDQDDYRFVTKKGEFEVTNFVAELRYPISYKAYEYVDFFYRHDLHLFPSIRNNDDDIRVRTALDLEYIAYPIEDRMIANDAAIISRWESDGSQIIFAGDTFKYIEAQGDNSMERGIFIHTGMLNTKQLNIRDNLKNIYAQTKEAYKQEAQIYGAMYSARYGGSSEGYRIFEIAMHVFAQANFGTVDLATINLGDLQMLFPDITCIAWSVEAGFLPYLPGSEGLLEGM